jgi:hypothetical protein
VGATPAAPSASKRQRHTQPVGWLKIVDYGDFYDVPRCIVVERNEALYALDCPFDDELDDYRSDYEVIRLPDTARELAATRFTPWQAVLAMGKSIGRIPVDAVRFDDTRRQAIDDSVFGLI